MFYKLQTNARHVEGDSLAAAAYDGYSSGFSVWPTDARATVGFFYS
jgi:hypothetical protein